MKLSSLRFRAIAVSSGICFWFFLISNSLQIFSWEVFFVVFSSLFLFTQIFVKRISKGLEILAIYNTKIFLGILYIFVFSIYGIFFRILRIDLLRLKRKEDTYWLKIDSNSKSRILKQY